MNGNKILVSPDASKRAFQLKTSSEPSSRLKPAHIGQPNPGLQNSQP